MTNCNTRIQFASDLHLEFGDLTPENYSRAIQPPSDGMKCILVLAGDIGDHRTLETFMSWCVENWTLVIYVPGNHEYYHTSIISRDRWLREMATKIGFVFLQKDVLAVKNKYGNDIVFVGCTLWSDIPTDHLDEMRNYLNDFNLIKEFKEKPWRYASLHKDHREWLTKTLKDLEGLEFTKVIVVTHHAPLKNGTSAPVFENKTTNCGFATDCFDLLDMCDLWIYGHTHHCTTIHYSERTKIMANQRGYRGANKKYNKTMMIEM